MKRLISLATFTVAALGLLAGFSGAAAAETISPNPITFETGQGYSVGNINGQNSWSKTGAYDANVVSTSRYGFGQALQISDATTSGSFGDQTFSPALTQAAGESAQTHFDATFQIGTTSDTAQAGSHLSVSPDNGSGGRMSYLRFEDQGDGVHVFFDDVTDSGPFYKMATFNETGIATLDRTTAHTIRFSIDFKPGPANDVVNIYIDNVLKATGTTWEDYYRYDNENQGSPAPVPTTTGLSFLERGTADPSNLGGGFLVDNVSYASSMTPPACTQTGLMRDGINLTAKQIGGTATGDVDATGCNIGVYYAPGTTGTVNAANIHGANYYGVVVNAAAVSVTNSSIHNIGEVPFNGTQHGVGVLYTTINQALATTGPAATGTLSGNTITLYQKNGVVVSGTGAVVTVQNNTVTGNGPVSYIAQNGIQMSYGATGTISGNTVSRNEYTGANGASSGGIIIVGGAYYFGLPYSTDISVTKNVVTNNDVGVWLSNAQADGSAPVTKTNNKVVSNTISKTDGATNVSGDGTCGYQVGIADEGNKDNIVNNTISGNGYVPTTSCATGTFRTAIDPLGSNHIHNN
jgi:hypothetical protein